MRTRSANGASGLSNGCLNVGTIHSSSTRGRAVARTHVMASWCDRCGGLKLPPYKATRTGEP
jgi:hypothetical protein